VPGAVATPARKKPKQTPSAPEDQSASVVVPRCMKRADLHHIRRLGSRKWQAVVVGFSDDKVFVDGPYASQGAAVAAARSVGKAYVGYQGGKYVAYSTRVSVGDSSLLAACLQAALGQHYAF
jgi:hypothetical protein